MIEEGSRFGDRLQQLIYEYLQSVFHLHQKRIQASEGLAYGYNSFQYIAESWEEYGKTKAYAESIGAIAYALEPYQGGRLHTFLSQMNWVADRFANKVGWKSYTVNPDDPKSVKTGDLNAFGAACIAQLGYGNCYSLTTGLMQYLREPDKNVFIESYCPSCEGNHIHRGVWHRFGYKTKMLKLGDNYVCQHCRKVHSEEQLIKVNQRFIELDKRKEYLRSLKKRELTDIAYEFNAGLTNDGYRKRINMRDFEASNKDLMVSQLINAEFRDLNQRKNR